MIDEQLDLDLETRAGRLEATALDPLTFALIYMRRHLTMELSDVHRSWAGMARQWVSGLPSRNAFIAPRDMGKALAVDTPVLTGNRGWVAHGDLKSGDRVFSETGEQCNVIAVRHWQDRPAYLMKFSDGSSIVADANHEWQVLEDRRTVIRTTESMAADAHVVTDRGMHEHRYALEAQGALEIDEADLPIAPWALGAWLGDGSSGGAGVTVGGAEIEYMKRKFAECGETFNVRLQGDGRNYTLQMLRPDPSSCYRGHKLDENRICETCALARRRPGFKTYDYVNSPFNRRLNGMGLLNNKHIPERYFMASRQQRLELIQGLMDTDGYVGGDGAAGLGLTNKRLAYDALLMLRTLGVKASIYVKQVNARGGGKRPFYCINFKTPLPIAAMPRKAERLPSTVSTRSTRRRIVSIERVENQDTNCIQVDSPSHLYLAGEGLLPTHNSTWFFLILPMWAAAHGHARFIAAFADSARQSEGHLRTFKNELDSNPLLKEDFPDLCSPATRSSGTTISDNQSDYYAKSGFIFAARGIDAAVLGLKVDEKRPDVIIFDDIEPDEANYSIYQALKRRGTVRDAILPMNIFARVVFVGTVTMIGGIMHQFVQKATIASPSPDMAKELAWVAEDQITPHYYAPVITQPDGTEKSIWPEKWPMEYLNRIRKTRPYSKNFLNKPTALDGTYWCDEDFEYGDPAGTTKTIISVDPAVTTKQSSDYTGIAILSLNPVVRKIIVRDCYQVKLGGAALRERLIELIEESDVPIVGILVEVNQGGDLWRDILHHMPVPVRVKSQSVKKEVRAAGLLSHYQRHRILHRAPMPQLEEQMTSFPNVLHDDMIDAVGTGVDYFIKAPKAGAHPGGSSVSYTT